MAKELVRQYKPGGPIHHVSELLAKKFNKLERGSMGSPGDGSVTLGHRPWWCCHTCRETRGSEMLQQGIRRMVGNVGHVGQVALPATLANKVA
jgi:hypothetical protein